MAVLVRPERDVLDSILRTDLVSFIHKVFGTVSPGEPFLPNWHIEAIAHHLMLCFQGHITRLLITLPPRHLKSIAASVAFPAFVLGHNPSAQVICASYGLDLARFHSRARRRVIGATWFKETFPLTRVAKSPDSAEEFSTTMGGHCLATSVGGLLTGLGAGVIILDDVNKTDDANSIAALEAALRWYQGSLLSRLNDKRKGMIIVIQQRIHQQDLAGFVLQEEGWTHLNLPAIAEEDVFIPIGPNRTYLRKASTVLHEAREPISVYQRYRKAMGSERFEGQYQQRPAPPGGLIIQRKWFGLYEKLPEKTPDNSIIQSWDTASSIRDGADFSVCTTWLMTKSKCYLIDVKRERLEYPTLKRFVVNHAADYRAEVVLIENSNSGMPLLQELRERGGITAIGIKPDGEKRERAQHESPMIESGLVHLPREAAWLGEFLGEILMFPNTKHDDQVDSMSQFLWWVRQQRHAPEYPFVTPTRLGGGWAAGGGFGSLTGGGSRWP